jgi:hypothetical protein
MITWLHTDWHMHNFKAKCTSNLIFNGLSKRIYFWFCCFFGCFLFLFLFQFLSFFLFLLFLIYFYFILWFRFCLWFLQVCSLLLLLFFLVFCWG